MRAFVAAVAIALLLAAHAAPATWPEYQNTVRVWGTVEQIYPTVIPPEPPYVVAIVLVVPQGASEYVYVRLECGPVVSPAVGCDQVAMGDSLLVSGHLGDRLSCHHDGIDNVIVPNVLWRCNGGPCVQLTP